jgi:uncharacterized iron-regulated protein
MNKSEYLELEKRARKLSKEMAYVSEMNRLCSSLVHSTSALLKLMDENTTKDNTFGELVAQTNGAAHAKVQTADTWLIEARTRLDRFTSRLAEESISDA